MDPVTGEVDVPAGTPAGTYTIEYEICDNANPTFCTTSTVTVTVDAPAIEAEPESFPTINGETGGVTTTVLASDMLNGVVVDPADITITSTTSSDPNVTLDPATGLITVAPGTPAGTYTVEYQICENNNPTNCATVTETVVVGEPEIDALPEVFAPINGADGGVTTSVLASDTLNGVAVDPADITITSTISSDPNVTLDPATGLITVATGTPAGTYTVEYEICENNNPTNCATVTETVVVGEPEIDALPEVFAPINGTDGGVTTSVLASDTLNGVAIDPDDITLTVLNSDPALTLDPATGLITVAAGTPAGTYTVEYEICEDLNPDNCATVTETVTVEEPPIDSVDDSATGVNGEDGATGVLNVFDNDTLNGVPVDPADVTLTETISDPTGALTLNPDGSVDVAPGTPAGNYELTYEICETLNPTNCTTSVVTVTVDAPEIDALPETFPPVSGADGGVTTSVLASDVLNGVTVDPADVTITATTSSDPNVTLDPATGLITIAPGTPAGTYTVEYTICENNNPTNCATVTETITVEEPPINATDDSATGINGVDGATGVVNAFDNDTLNGQPVDPADITAEILTPATPLVPGAPVPVMDPVTGLVDVPAGTPAGTYIIEYEICETLNPENCTIATVTIEVEAPEIEALPESFPPIDSRAGGVTTSVLASDTLNGVAVDPEDVTITSTTSSHPNVTLDPATGLITVAPNTPEGTYTVEYTICEDLNPDNCATVTETIIVEPANGVLSGTVYLDSNGNREPDTDETVFAGWIVRVIDDAGNVIAEIITDENGFYETELPFGDFSVSFVNPDSGAVYSETDITIGSSSVSVTDANEVVINLPIDPSGVFYDAVTREPVEGVIATFVDDQGVPLPPICFIDPSQQDQTSDSLGQYRFDLVPGADPACPVGQMNYRIEFDAPPSHLDTLSTIIGVTPGSLLPNAGTGPFLVQTQDTAPQAGDATTYYLEFTLGQGSRDVINNHIPLDPVGFERSPLDVTKSTPSVNVNFGDIVPYTITVTNSEDLPRVDLDIVDFTPPGFVYIEDTSRLDGVELDPTQNGRELILEDIDLAPNETRTWTMMLVVGAGVSEGVYTNQAFARDPLGEEVSSRAEAVVRLVPDPLFDCSELIGKVFDDKDQDGYQDEGEPGLAAVRLATANGLLVTTDDHGRYHIACAAVPNGQIGSNFILKVDQNTLPTGYELTTENPRVVRLTRGKNSKANFGASLGNVVHLSVSDNAFETGTNTLRPEFSAELGQMIDHLKTEHSTLDVTYLASTPSAPARLDALVAQIHELWEVHGGDYDLKIQRKLVHKAHASNAHVGGEE